MAFGPGTTRPLYHTSLCLDPSTWGAGCWWFIHTRQSASEARVLACPEELEFSGFQTVA